MPTITFDLPEGALSALRLSPTEFVKEMRVAAALLWYSHGRISQSKAAEIAGTSRAEFINELSYRHIPVVQVTAEELQARFIVSEAWVLNASPLILFARIGRFDFIERFVPAILIAMPFSTRLCSG